MQPQSEETLAFETTPFISNTAFAPRLSVIIPALNEEKLLARTLDAFPQDLRARYGVEIVVSDGGSSDRTAEIAQARADTFIRHDAPTRQTIAAGRNAGASRARGEALVFLNADTVPADPEAFAAAIVRRYYSTETDGAPRSEAKNLVFACPVAIAPEERRWSDALFHAFFNAYTRLLNLAGVGMGRGECQIVAREAFGAAGGYNERIAAGEDFDLYRRLRRRGRIGWLKEALVYESPRRFRRFGYARIAWMWTINALSVLARRKAVSEEWEAVR